MNHPMQGPQTEFSFSRVDASPGGWGWLRSASGTGAGQLNPCHAVAEPSGRGCDTLGELPPCSAGRGEALSHAYGKKKQNKTSLKMPNSVLLADGHGRAEGAVRAAKHRQRLLPKDQRFPASPLLLAAGRLTPGSLLSTWGKQPGPGDASRGPRPVLVAWCAGSAAGAAGWV